MKNVFFILLTFSTLAGCDTTSSSTHVDEVIVESYLVAGEDLPQVRLTLSVGIEAKFVVSDRAIADATVFIKLLDNTGLEEAAFPYSPDPSTPGIYLADRDHLVLEQRTYKLDVSIPGREPVTAQTIVPAQFELRDLNVDTAPFQGDDQFELNITPSFYPGRQNIFVFSIEALSPDVRELTPLYLDIIYDIKEDEAFDPDSLELDDLDPFLFYGSPPINEGNYEVQPDGTIIIKLPWFFVVFYGSNRVFTSAIDDGLYDFMRYQQVQAGGSTLSPGEIPNILDHIEGGRGVFGSLARVSTDIIVTRQ